MKKRSHGRVERRCSATRKTLLRHLLDPSQQAILLHSAEILDVDHVVTDEALDFLLDLWGIGVLAPLRVRCEEARNHDAVDGGDRVSLRDAEDDHGPPSEGEDVPHARHAYGTGVGEGKSIVGVVAPIAEAVETQRTRAA
jgi:hypothetical protein